VLGREAHAVSASIVVKATVALLLLAPAHSSALELVCRVTRKIDSERVYTERQLRDGQFSVRIVEESSGAKLSRCSYAPSQNRVTCDAYVVDRVEKDANVDIKKFYVFGGQFDVQVFADLSYVENNGRGGISFGTCRAGRP
jgi:hypothetical protein